MNRDLKLSFLQKEGSNSFSCPNQLTKVSTIRSHKVNRSINLDGNSLLTGAESRATLSILWKRTFFISSTNRQKRGINLRPFQIFKPMRSVFIYLWGYFRYLATIIFVLETFEIVFHCQGEIKHAPCCFQHLKGCKSIPCF